MKKLLLPCLIVLLGLISMPAFSQDAKGSKDAKNDKDTLPMLGLAGDNLDLYAVLDLFQKSKTIEAFEKSLNDPKEKLNNLDLNLDNKVDFIKVVTKKDEDSYRFILQDDISKTETQDIAVILLDRNKDKKISLQIVGDEELYGKDYVIEPKGNSPVTPNPAYKGEDPVTVAVPATTTVVVQSAPIVQYVYSPAYVPYAPPYYYGYYPPWFGFATVMAVGIYRSNHYYHGGYYGGHYHGGNNTVIINNRNSINHYNNTRNRSTTVSDNRARGSYGNGSIDGSRGGRNNASTRPSNTPSNRPSASTRPSNTPSNRPSASTRPTTSDRAGGGSSFSNRQSPSPSTRQSSNLNSRSGSGFSGGGGGRSMGGGARGGGGGGRRR